MLMNGFPVYKKISEYKKIPLRVEIEYIWICLRETVKILVEYVRGM
jgi:hypothetical protein